MNQIIDETKSFKFIGMLNMATVTTSHLNDLHEELKRFADPGNHDGFFKLFCAWVAREWGSRDYYEPTTPKSDDQVSVAPHDTHQKLSSITPKYCEFINAIDGRTNTRALSNDLAQFFSDSCFELIEDFVEKNQLTLSEKDSQYANNVVDAIKRESFTDDELCNVASEIATEFEPAGSAIKAFLCPGEPGHYQENLYGQWTLDDFKKALTE